MVQDAAPAKLLAHDPRQRVVFRFRYVAYPEFRAVKLIARSEAGYYRDAPFQSGDYQIKLAGNKIHGVFIIVVSLPEKILPCLGFVAPCQRDGANMRIDVPRRSAMTSALYFQGSRLWARSWRLTFDSDTVS
jgi:hypothetical protein